MVAVFNLTQGFNLSCLFIQLSKEMATMNPFDLLGDDDNDDPTQLIVAAQLKVEKPKKPSAPAQPQAQAQPAKSAKLPTKPLPPAQAGELRFAFYVLHD